MGRYSVLRYKTKRRTRDLDLIHGDLSTPESIQNLKHQEQDEYKAGLGQYYCIHCAKYFQDNKALAAHLKCKPHRRRVKELSVNPYTQLESDAASGTNLPQFTDKVNKYKQTEPVRKEMENQLLSTQLAENDEKDKIRDAMLQPPVEEGQVVEAEAEAPTDQIIED
ncbi:hypothetical protein CANARDRAFT_7080 [[Candida] arabinofermentans NRRL YB-2248]|uniref:C2H2-type domain-containing protein n=1 Tax=[Candida] arabinofermentans NRRL YB-2248 TaxID=983967 RepID=A0A1E4T1U6_9ASCO|nr:hypothetical protein CANARDRAFT_7080 [[Candida] arabinofermentans NRRL YB-2248]